ncbi:MAG: nucleotidyltransferase domain-containing protein [Candidatus Caenarcaniphilales bacterium]|nr:nucleotidyltransferase domain-containing protein [Candidatus Caenarcaniphilales bacterium]
MNSSANQDPEFEKKEVLEFLHGSGARVYLFGSQAAGKNHPSSDIDLAIESELALPAGLLAELRDKLENSNILCKVDLFELREADKKPR